jgi:hypothetical protein
MSTAITEIEAALREHSFAELTLRLDPPSAELHLDGEFIAQGLPPHQSWQLTHDEARTLLGRCVADHVIG